MKDMPKHIRIGKTPLIFFYFFTPLGAVNFCACLLKPLDRSLSYGHARFSQTFIKNFRAQNG